MGKFVIRTGWCGFAVACGFLALPWRTTLLFPRGVYLEAAAWPASIIGIVVSGLTLRAFFEIGFSALLNGAYYAGMAWLMWWGARLAGRVKAEPSAKARFISLFLASGLGFALLLALTEAAIHRPKFSAEGFLGAYMISANLFSLIVLTCALAGWAFWWFLRFLTRRGAAGPA